MAEIDFTQIFDGVTLALHRAFPTVNIHGETVDQDLHPGDFNVLPIAPSHTAQMGARAKKAITFDVIYYPTNSGGRSECLERANELPGILGTITTPNGDKVHCYKFEHTIDDEVLHCIVTYQYFVYSSESKDAMETIKY
jgi:hypothetical protein